MERFDLTILDEASQSDTASCLPALYRARLACVVGDDHQVVLADMERAESSMHIPRVASTN